MSTYGQSDFNSATGQGGGYVDKAGASHQIPQGAVHYDDTTGMYLSGAAASSGSGIGTGTGSGGSGTYSTSSSSPEMISGMKDIYNQLLGINQQHYGNVQNAYNSAQQNLSSALPSIYSGYNQLSSNVMNTLGLGTGGWGVAAPAAAAIGQQAAKTQGAATQQLTDRGLGNTTAVQNVADQNSLYTQEAYGSLGSQLAQTAAGYQSNIGEAGLSAQMTGLQTQSGLTSNALSALGQQESNTAGSLWGNTSTGYSQNTSLQTQNLNGQTAISANPYDTGYYGSNYGGGSGSSGLSYNPGTSMHANIAAGSGGGGVGGISGLGSSQNMGQNAEQASHPYEASQGGTLTGLDNNYQGGFTSPSAAAYYGGGYSGGGVGGYMAGGGE